MKPEIFAAVGTSVDFRSTQNIYELFFFKLLLYFLSPFAGLKENYKYSTTRPPRFLRMSMRTISSKNSPKSMATLFANGISATEGLKGLNSLCPNYLSFIIMG